MRKRIIISQYSALQINRLLTALIVAMLMFLPVSVSAEDEPPTILITGSNASHGLAFAEEYAALGWNVIATCRTPAKADRLNALAEKFPNVVVEELDIVDVDEINALVEKYQGKPIDVLLNNAAINAMRFGPNRFGKIDYEWFEEILKVNIIGQLRVSEAFQDNVAASKQKKIISMTSNGGSIGEVKVPNAPAYRASKAGLNMAMRTYSLALKPKGIIVGLIAPGTVDTEDYLNAEDPSTVPSSYETMIKMNLLSPRRAIDEMIALIDRLTLEDSGVYYWWTGRVIPW
ncbi:MAG: SDR family NAD(P)-dependent oxidoreductase [Gammaproteobacteria bacterium]|nr:SDR family NAD(P)-dependent oxidoreductase [Gammaproteobacteria bacterium]MDP7297567.1 SDR family NAD(P)-dependent oxidoreductase [Gammaproteobacteria bacterium]MDP7420196.1 SDR family NAD(P)-dependent oxidoreductase [Gammaproteobacteria bacterium]HJP40071.1 SDR family NAD(P)-dependent oxidoreductase [Gammaproteobacteria bacterium]